jgi:hypothetical protein
MRYALVETVMKKVFEGSQLIGGAPASVPTGTNI